MLGAKDQLTTPIPEYTGDAHGHARVWRQSVTLYVPRHQTFNSGLTNLRHSKYPEPRFAGISNALRGGRVVERPVLSYTGLVPYIYVKLVYVWYM
jgi:hypothetical protein